MSRTLFYRLAFPDEVGYILGKKTFSLMWQGSLCGVISHFEFSRLSKWMLSLHLLAPTHVLTITNTPQNVAGLEYRNALILPSTKLLDVDQDTIASRTDRIEFFSPLSRNLVIGEINLYPNFETTDIQY